MYGKVDRKKGEFKETRDDKEIKYFIVKNNERYSLLVRSTEDPTDESLGMFHHYYSEKNTYLKNELEDYGYKYKNIFDYGINSCCKILELCIIFVIYYNLKTGKNDYHLKCLDYDTIKGVLMVLMI